MFLGTVLTAEEFSNGDLVRGTMRVNRAYSEVKAGETLFWQHGGMCPPETLLKGREYLVVAWNQRNRWQLIGCGWTISAERAHHRIAWLDRYLAGKTPTVLEGTVRVRERLRSIRRDSILLLLVGLLTGTKHRVVTGARGEFRVELPGDLYRMTSLKTGWFAMTDGAERDNEILVKPGACKAVDILLAPEPDPPPDP